MIIQENDRFVIHGPITMSNASAVLEEGVDLLNQGEMVIDFAQVACGIERHDAALF